MNTPTRKRALLLAIAMLVITAASTRMNADTGTCGGASIALPFTDVLASNVFFCSIAEAYFSGLTNGTTPTTFNPGDPVPREQMAAFVSRTMDQSVKRSGKRAQLDQFWTNQGGSNLALTSVGGACYAVKSDGTDLWVSSQNNSTVTRVRASDGRVVETWTGASFAYGVLVAMGKVFVTGAPGSKLFQIDPTQPAGAVTTVTSSLGTGPVAAAFDGQRIWTANQGGSISIVTLSPLNVTTITAGFTTPSGVVFDGTNIWVTDNGDSTLKKLDSSGNVLMTVLAGTGAWQPVFDGTNIWVPNYISNTVTVVRATGGIAGTVLATLTGNGLSTPFSAAFDGERILIANNGDSVSLWRASDLTPIGTFPTGAFTTPLAACSDSLNFWITLGQSGKLARF